MKIKDYEEFVINNSKQQLTDINYSFIGLAGETGECLEWYKKSILRHDTRFSEEDLKNELGDVLFYLTRITKFYNWTLKEIMETNINKLVERQKGDK